MNGSDVPISPLPVSPQTPIDVDEADGEHDPSYEAPEDAGIDLAKGVERLDEEEWVCVPCDGEDSVMKPKLFPSPRAPSKAEIELHNITHLPYRNWCPWCVAGRRNNTQHRELKEKHARTEPCLHLDYAFLSDEV